ncbi:MAG: hypothetical protein M0Z55_11130 [Peptococcaceae bacterium]|nr:hypothetical protein [Peptococcaceae bacterium]
MFRKISLRLNSKPTGLEVKLKPMRSGIKDYLDIAPRFPASILPESLTKPKDSKSVS